jgi:hypothetical protein
MTLQTFEQSLSGAQLKKGLDYFDNGYISDLEEWESGKWNAIVSGSDDYHVKITLKKDVVTECSCDCPHDVDYCKHIIAVLYALKEERDSPPVKTNIKRSTTGVSKKMKAKDAVAGIINKISEKELRRFIIEYAETDREFRNMLQAHFADKSGEDGKTIYGAMIQNAARIAADRHGFIDYYNANKAIQPVNVLLQKADAALAKKHYVVVADIAFAVIENVHDIMTDMDDSDGAAGDCINEGFELLLKLCEADIPFDLKERIFIDADKEVKNSKYDYAGFDEHWLDVLVHAAYGQEKKMQLLQTIDTMLTNVAQKTADNWSKEYKITRLLAYEMTLLRRMQRNKEADDLRLRHIDIADFRMELIEEVLAKEEYSKVKHLIATGITIAKEKGSPGTVDSYKKILLRVADKQRDITAIRAIAKELYAGRNMEYYRMMKSTYNVEEWPLIAENFITELQKPDKTFRGFHGTINGDALAAIFIEEKYWERLLNLIQNDSRLEFIETYSRLLLGKFPTELLAVYKEAIIKYAGENTGRNYYVTIRELLKKIQKWEGGKEVVKQLISQFILQYKSRKAMIEELGKLLV